MSEENGEIVRAVFEAWNRRDFEAGLRLAAPDIEFHPIGGFADLVGDRFKGHDGVLRIWREMAETVEWINVDDAVDLGDQVVVTVHIERNRGRKWCARQDAEWVFVHLPQREGEPG